MKYEVVCTENYWDVGLTIDWDLKSNPTRVLARSSSYDMDAEYGGVELLTWIRTGIFLSIDEWKDISYNKSTDDILEELGIKKIKKAYSKQTIIKPTEVKERNGNMTTFRKELFKFFHAVSFGVWCTSMFIAIFYDNSIPMWISLIVMNILSILKDECR